MSDHTPTQEQSQNIPYGYCHCGCGQLAPIAKKTHKRSGHIKGQPARFIFGHYARTLVRVLEGPHPSIYCRCGCGQLAPLAKVTRRKLGQVKGQPLSVIFGHSTRTRDTLPDPNPSGLCMCGCGQSTNIAKMTNVRRGQVAGKHMRFLPNHAYGFNFPLAKRFWAKVNKNGPTHPILGTPCWLWTAGHNGRGYGTITLDGPDYRREYAHRVSFEMANGPFARDMEVCHKCDNPPCVNPHHLFLGTAMDNTKDKIAKDRHARGSRCGQAKLTEEDVVEILALIGTGMEHKAIAARFDVTPTIISCIHRNITWKHVPRQGAKA